METGFLNPIHDEEHFSSPFYNQGHELDANEHILFGEMIVPEIIDYDSLWPSNDDTEVGEEDQAQKEEFQKMLHEWQNHLDYMQEPEAIRQKVPLGNNTTEEVPEMFPSSDTSCARPTPAPAVDPSIDELFPLETPKTNPPVNTEATLKYREAFAVTTELRKIIKKEPEPTGTFQEELELSSNITKLGVKTAASNDNLLQKPHIFLKKEVEEEPEKEVDVETVESEEVPLLMAGDLTSLLEQFEATEKVNAVQTPPSPPRPSSQTIRDALPMEVIQRIKASRENHKKVIPVIPAMPNKRPGKAATRMQDAGATLSRNKLLKLITGGSSGESVQLDHDYCTNGGDSTASSSRSYYMSDSSEYPSQSSTPDTSSRLPDFKISKDSGRVCDTGSRKDSGLESGENSDEEVPLVNETKSKIVFKNGIGQKSISLVNETRVTGNKNSLLRKNIPMVSVLKKNIKVEKDALNSSEISNQCASPVVHSDVASTQCEMDKQEIVRKKKKLNLEEYRVRREERERIRSQESSRANSPVPCPTPPAQPDSTSQEGVPKEKPLMHSVEVQTQTCDFIDLTSSNSSKDQEKSRMDSKDKRNDLKHRSYQSRHASSSSSSCSAESDRHRSHRRKTSRRKRSRSRRKSSVSRMWSRSPSRSSSGSSSDSSSRSRSRSRSRDGYRRQKWRSRSPRRSHHHDSSRNYRIDRDRAMERDRSWQRNHSPVRSTSSRSQEFPTQEKTKQVEERRVIYVGRIDEGTTKADLRKRFQQFGPIVDISVHFRERGDNYGFVTFAYKADAYKAVEHGNDDPKLPRYDLCFGGRRAFCKQRYADLDGMATNMQCRYGPPPAMQPRSNDSFDLLLNEVKAKLRKRSCV
ncbi:serine/arginine repetitive matrix protein 2-like [Macrosteles quadrilineatus]|uniref:serine/arginine repetitive matrix protein 2-like n=1 Tax=Macrosteles quadrilineatus TaxID=74068 RepID=UPI0023E29BD2|nr:serine/arginine repetitive matrix protein 2-like [Macrosteles quadrilineatus]